MIRVAMGLVLIWVWGDLVLKGPRSWLERLSAGWVLGCCISSMLVFGGMWAGLRLDTAVFAVSGVGLVLWLFQVSPPAPLLVGPKGPLAWLFAALIFVQTGLVAFAAWVSPLNAWDAWVNFASKASILFQDQALSPALYQDVSRLPTNLDYPLMLPISEAWLYTWAGGVEERFAGGIAFLFYAALLALFYVAMRRMLLPTAALGFTAILATVPRIERGAHCGLADLPLTSLVLFWFMEKSGAETPSRWLLLGLMAGLFPWIKLEGNIWMVLVILSFCQYPQKVRLSPLYTRLFPFLVPTLLLAALWPLFLHLHGTIHYVYFPVTAENIVAHLPRIPMIARAMVERLFNPYWNFVWVFVVLLLLGRRAAIPKAPAGNLIVPVLGFLVFCNVGYLLTRFDPWQEQLQNSAERLILQPLPLALWWIAGQCVAMGWFLSDARKRDA